MKFEDYERSIELENENARLREENAHLREENARLRKALIDSNQKLCLAPKNNELVTALNKMANYDNYMKFVFEKNGRFYTKK